MLTVILQVQASSGQGIGIKEDIAMRLEPLGGVRVVSITEDAPEQLYVAGFGAAQGPAGTARKLHSGGFHHDRN